MMGELRLEPGEVKITYGTSAMLDLNAGPEPLWSMQGTYPLVLWRRAGRVTFCLEGTAITAGAPLPPLRGGGGGVRTAAGGGGRRTHARTPITAQNRMAAFAC